MANSPAIEVSVLLTTYEQAPYIAESIEGVLAQQAPFAWELLIGEDASTDETAEIVRRYAAEHPERIRAFLAERNEGGHRNFDRLLQAARGRYVAWCEGDDYWTDPSKLAVQAAYLDAHPDIALCFHRALLAYEDAPSRAPRASNEDEPARQTIADLGLRNSIRTPTVMFRAGLVERLPDWFFALPVGDWPLFVLLAHHGDVGFIDETMCVRRITGTGAWTKQDTKTQLSHLIHTADVLRRNVAPEHRAAMNRGYLRFCRRGVRKMLKRGDLVSAWRALWRLGEGALRHPFLLRRQNSTR